MEHKELRQLLDAMIHAARVSFEMTSDLLPFAVALNDQGKIRQLTFPERPDRLVFGKHEMVIVRGG